MLLSLLSHLSVISQAQDLPGLLRQAGNSVADVIVLPAGGGSAVDLTTTARPDTIVDLRFIPAGELIGLNGPAARRNTDSKIVDQEREQSVSLDGRQWCSDADKDGVCDADDYCSATPAGSIVMPSGCHLTPEVPLELVGVFFDFNGSELRPESYEILGRVVALLRQQSEVIVEIGGHADARGSVSANMEISGKRAKAVHDYLIDQGIAPYRLRYKAYGPSQPVAPNALASGADNADGRARNRRVDMRVVGDLAALKRGIKD